MTFAAAQSTPPTRATPRGGSLRVLVLSQYPIKTPMHGGQVRLRAVTDALRRCGCEVETIGIFPDFAFPPEQRGSLDVVIASNAFNDAYFAEPLFGDLAITSFLLSRPALRDMAFSRIASFSPDVIWLEHPFLYPLVEEARTYGITTKLVYSSANDESALKRILVALDTGPGSTDHSLIDEVAAIEEACIAGADYVVCINDEEAAALRAKGVRAAHLPATSPLDFEAAVAGGRRSPGRRTPRYAIYAASSYWLNVDGYFEVFGEGLGFLGPDERLMVVGSGCDAIWKDRRFERRRTISESRSLLRGFLPEDKLVEAYLGAEAIVIPILRGAGSNLKTADALAAGRPVISTPKGLAGYRSLLGDALGNGVYEAPTVLEFKQLVRAALRQELKSPPAALSRQFRRECGPALVLNLLKDWGLSEAAA
jgi:glycosyltransferase involved in cell wall biosynthesis